MIQKLRALLSRRDKLFLLFLLFFSILIALIETAGISIIMPFISVATDFSKVLSNKYFYFFYNFLNFSKPQSFVVAFGIFLIFFYTFRSFINLFYFYFLAKFSFSRYHIIAYKLFQNYIGFSYKDFINKNTSTLTKNIVNEAYNLTQLISNILFILSEIFIVLILYLLMIYVNWKMTVLLSIFLFLNGIFLIKTIAKKIKREGEKRVEFQKKFFEIINSTFGNFKFIKLIGNEKEILNKFNKASYGFALTNIKNNTLLHFPRLFLEALGFGIVAFIITYLIWKYNRDIKPALGLISMYVLALYRLLPSVNRILSSYNNIMFHKKSLDIVHNDLMYDVENLGDEEIEFDKKIEIKNLSFAFDNHSVLENINLIIEKGEKVAFTGESGAGKTTLLDLIIGIYKPTKGKILIDNYELNDKNVKSWRKKIGYIPQQIYLFDGTVGENVAFGRKFNEKKIIECLKKARIWKFFESKNGINTRVGEGGIMLSGGQKQRVAIARALYGDPEILVLDEATSALDYETEKEIMNEIYEIGKDKTLIIVAHRHSTIINCDKIYIIENKKVKLVN